MKHHAATILRVTLAILTGMFILVTANAFASQFTVLHNFAKSAEYPDSGLIIGPDGGFYGTSEGQNTSSCAPKPCGAVFVIKQTSTGWQYQVIHTFHGPKEDGEYPTGPLLFDSVGNLYGTTFSSVGHYGCFARHINCGTVFKLSHAPNGWAETVLYRFKDGADGALPEGNLVLDSAGNLYGTTFGGGSHNGNCGISGCGVVYELSPSSSGWKETVLYTFTGSSDGLEPEALPRTPAEIL
jgi:hypothetical protein